MFYIFNQLKILKTIKTYFISVYKIMLFIIIGHFIQVFGKAYGSLASYMNREKHMVLTESAFKAESSHRRKF